jgi:hypothetical protein
MGTSQKADGLWTMQKGEFEESVTALERQIVAAGGNPRELFDRLRTDKSYLASIVKFMISEQPIGLATEARIARAMLGNNMFGVEDWQALYGVKFTKKQIREAGKFPWSEDVLNGKCPFNPGKLVRETHFAFLGLTGINGEPLTVKKWMALHPATGQPRFYFASGPWHAGQPYADEATMELKWHLLLKSIVPGSTDKTPEQQVAMLPEEYEVPSTIAEVTKDILVFRKTNVRHNFSHWAACKERTIKTSKVDKGLVSCVGSFRGDGLRVYYWDGHSSHWLVGVGASRLPAGRQGS